MSERGENSEFPNTGRWRDAYPFVSHFADLDGQRLHYLDERPASATDNDTISTLLFVHGNPTWSFHWRRLIQAFRARYRCVAPDHLGCGLSDKPRRLLRLDDHIKNLAKLVDTLDLSNVTLVAQDWGGAIGLGALLRAPERFRRIVLFNTGAFPPRTIPGEFALAGCRSSAGWPCRAATCLAGPRSA